MNGGAIRQCLAVVVLLVVMAAAGQASASVESAVRFVERFGNQALNALDAPNLTSENRETLVRDLLRQGLEMNFIGRFAFGNYWRKAKPAQRSEYLALFEFYVVKIYASWLARNTGERLIVVDARQANEKDVIVRTRIDRRNDPPFYVEWRVRVFAGRERIIDIASNGISLAGNQRLEFSAVIKRNGIDGLITFLRERAAE